MLKLGSLTFDFENHVLIKNHREIWLPEAEYTILKALSDGKPKTREQILTALGYDGKDENYVDTRLVDAHVSRIRKKMGTARGCLATLSKIGYKLLISN